MESDEMKPFYELGQAERIRLTEDAISEKRTLLERWQCLNVREANPWEYRSSIAATLLRESASVSDFGCGTMNLKRHLRKNQVYVPIDVVARDEHTIVCDLNRGPLPATATTSAAFLGLLEYIYEPRKLLQDAAEKFETIVISYCVTDAKCPAANRREHAWVNAFSTAELENLFKEVGWQIRSVSCLDDVQKIWRLDSV